MDGHNQRKTRVISGEFGIKFCETHMNKKHYPKIVVDDVPSPPKPNIRSSIHAQLRLDQRAQIINRHIEQEAQQRAAMEWAKAHPMRARWLIFKLSAHIKLRKFLGKRT